MSSNHDQDNHSNEAKPVAFRTPLILGLVTVVIILLAVSTCDKKHGCCEDKEKCEASCESKHGEHSATVVHETESTDAAPLEAVETDEHTAVDSTVKVEEHAHH
jgi:hypothetical protein